MNLIDFVLMLIYLMQQPAISQVNHTLYFVNGDKRPTFHSFDISTSKVETIKTSVSLPSGICDWGGIVCDDIYYCAWVGDGAPSTSWGITAINIQNGITNIYTKHVEPIYGGLECNNNNHSTMNSIYAIAFTDEGKTIGLNILTFNDNKMDEKPIGTFSSINGYTSHGVWSNFNIDIYNQIFYASFIGQSGYGDAILRLMDITTGKELGNSPFKYNKIADYHPVFLAPPNTNNQLYSTLYGMMEWDWSNIYDSGTVFTYYTFNLDTHKNEITPTYWKNQSSWIGSLQPSVYCKYSHGNENGYESYGFDVSLASIEKIIYRFNTTTGDLLDSYDMKQYLTDVEVLGLACL